MAKRQPFPVVVQLKPAVPSSRWKNWVRWFGVSRLARALGVRRETVHTWIRQYRTPKENAVKQMIAISELEEYRPEDGAPLTHEDILGPASADRVEVRN